MENMNKVSDEQIDEQINEYLAKYNRIVQYYVNEVNEKVKSSEAKKDVFAPNPMVIESIIL